jgi:hypothetical protein
MPGGALINGLIIALGDCVVHRCEMRESRAIGNKESSNARQCLGLGIRMLSEGTSRILYSRPASSTI